MRREVIQQGVRRIVSDLSESGIVGMLEQGLERFRERAGKERDEIDWLSLPVLADFFTRSSTYGEVEIKILDILEISDLTNPSFWSPHMTRLDPSFVFGMSQKIQFAISNLPKILSLMDREFDAGNTKNKKSDDVVIQTVILSDEVGALSSPQRLVELLQSFQQIYDVVSEVYGLKDSDLAIVAIDSGSEKSFDFLGIAQLMKEIRETLQSVYNMVAFHKQNITIKNLQVAGESIAVVAEINKLENSGAMSAEEANRLRHSMFAALERFAGTGAYIPEMSVSVQSPALTMRPLPRLLTGPAEDIVRKAKDGDHQDSIRAAETRRQKDPDNQHGDFSEEELRNAARLLRQAALRPSQDDVTQQPKQRRRPTKK